MQLCRCDRCGREYDGKSYDFYRSFGVPRGPYGNYEETREMERKVLIPQHDLCPDCLEGLRHVLGQADRIIEMYFSWEMTKFLYQEYSLKCAKWIGPGNGKQLPETVEPPPPADH